MLLTMIMIDISVGRSVALGDNPLHDLVAVQLFRQSLFVDLERFEIFSRRRLVLQDTLTSGPDRLDVVLDPLEALESLELLVRLPSVVNVRVSLPLDEKA